MTYRVGQAVVCVDLSQPRNTAFPPVETVLKLRGVYRVSEVHNTTRADGLSGGTIIGIEGIPRWLWEAGRFRPIEPASSDFCTLIARWPAGIPSWTVYAPAAVPA